LFGQKCQAMSEFQRRHIAWENGVLLPLAKRRLTAGDIADLGRAMAGRRGVTLDSEESDADADTKHGDGGGHE
jgi:hypothetical protein